MEAERTSVCVPSRSPRCRTTDSLTHFCNHVLSDLHLWNRDSMCDCPRRVRPTPLSEPGQDSDCRKMRHVSRRNRAVRLARRTVSWHAGRPIWPFPNSTRQSWQGGYPARTTNCIGTPFTDAPGFAQLDRGGADRRLMNVPEQHRDHCRYSQLDSSHWFGFLFNRDSSSKRMSLYRNCPQTAGHFHMHVSVGGSHLE